MIYLTFSLTIFFCFYGLLLLRLERKNRIQKRLAIFINGEKPNKILKNKNEHQSLFKRLIGPIFLDFKRSFKKRMPGEKEAKIEKKLQLAGNPRGMTAIDFRMWQLGLFILFPLGFGGFAVLLHGGITAIVIFVFLGMLIGLGTPHLYLKQKIKVRNRLALRELPDILDLLTVSLEAGLGFDSAVNKVVAKKKGVIAGEFHRCLEEIRLGKTRREALGGIRNRLEVDQVKTFISSILQAEKLGIGMVQVLRAQSTEVREQRKQRAEEEAMKAPIKMLFPLVLFIFPSLFIVLLGPAIIQFIDTFKK
jgi:tight adherence protein C